MSYIVDGDSEASNNAAAYIWKNYKAVVEQLGDRGLPIKFEEEFNCILDYGKDERDNLTYPLWIQFETEQEMMMFLLRFA